MIAHSVLLLVKTNVTQRLAGIHRIAGQCGWTLQTESVAMPPKNWSGDGVLVMLEDSPRLLRYIQELRARGIPVVDILETCPKVNLVRVTGDDVEIGRLAAEHFNERKFLHAAFFSASNDYCHTLRWRGFRNAWRGKKPFSWLWTKASAAQPQTPHAMRVWLTEKLRKAPKPLAVFAWNDTDAVHVLNACRAANLNVPNEVSILGVDNKTMICEQQSVKLSSIAHDLPRIGAVAAATLERLMSGGKVKRRLTRIQPRGIVTRESTAKIATSDNELRPAITYIHTHLAQPFGAAQIAHALGIPRVRLDRLFAAKLGHSVGTEITAQRIAHAQTLLRETPKTIAEIARQCGFCNTSFFIKNFRKATGTTPLAYRKSITPKKRTLSR